MWSLKFAKKRTEPYITQLFEVGMYPLFLLYGVDMPLQDRLFEIAAKIVKEQDAELIDVEVKGNGPGALFLIYADTVAGITLGECARISRAIQDELDIDGGFPERYRLEVSSPGLTRPLTTDFQLRKNIGQNISVRFDPDSKLQKVSGLLTAFTEKRLNIRMADGSLKSLNREKVKTIKIKLEW